MKIFVDQQAPVRHSKPWPRHDSHEGHEGHHKARSPGNKQPAPNTPEHNPPRIYPMPDDVVHGRAAPQRNPTGNMPAVINGQGMVELKQPLVRPAKGS